MLSKTIPGTNIEYKGNTDAFSVLKPMIQVTGGLSLSQICRITGLQTSTIQNWVKREYVPRPEKKKYHERHLSRILLISALRDCMNIEDIGELMVLINGDTNDEADDIVSEEKLYDCFCKTIYNLEIGSLSEKNIDSTIRNTLSDESDLHREKLVLALKVMVYAYISGRCLKQIEASLEELRRS